MSSMEVGGYDLSDPQQLQSFLGMLFADPTMLPLSLTNWLPNYLSVQPPQITADQIEGFQQFTAQATAQIAAEESTTSTSYTTLTTPGPALTGLGPGSYVVTYNASAKISSSATRARMNIGVNGALPNDTGASATPLAYTSNTGGMVGIGAQGVLSLPRETTTNSITLMYAVGVGGTGTATFGARSLSCYRISTQ